MAEFYSARAGKSRRFRGLICHRRSQCVEMVEYFAKWRSELDQPAKVAASEGYEGYGVPMAVDR